jgi:YfiH family protein
MHEHDLGHFREDSDVTVFFGHKNSSREAVAKAFPDFSLSILRQTHSDLVVPAPFGEPVPEADAQFTQTRKLALCIRTADCIPVLIHDPESKTVAAIHAGWRGVENEIIRKSGNHLINSGRSLRQAHAWIGPHIGAKSFEAGRDVAAALEARFEAVRGFSEATTSLLPHTNPEKAYVDLLLIARAQLLSIGIDAEKTTELAIDTFASPAHESFRRDRDRAGRQISFIALK